jgi:hypothetical protein
VQVEKNADEDILRIDLGGTERMTFQHDGNNLRMDLLEDYGNLFIGKSAGAVNAPFYKAGTQNTFVGQESGEANTNGFYNTFLGKSAGNANTTGSTNTFIGQRTGANNTEGSKNTFIGSLAGSANSMGSSNSALGYQAGYLNSTGAGNVFLGYQAGYYETDSNKLYISNSNADTTRALIYGDFEEGFVSIGGELMVDIDGNRRFGFLVDTNNNCRLHIEDPLYNIAIGYETGGANNTGNANVWIGDLAAFYNTDGSGNVFIGWNSGLNNTGGDGNVFVGKLSGRNNDTGSENVFIGTNSGYNTTGGNYNVFVGSQAGHKNSISNYNTFVGKGAGQWNETGEHNTLVGAVAGNHGRSGDDNVMIGYMSGYQDTTGSSNTFVGTRAGFWVDSGLYNVIVGDSAGYNLHSCNYNTFIGRASGAKNSGGSGNTFLGFHSGKEHHLGGNNTFIGTEAGYDNWGGEGNLFLGNQAGMNETGSNLLYIANDSTETPLIYGEFYNKKLRINGTLEVDRNNNGNLAELAYKADGVFKCSEGYDIDNSRYFFYENGVGNVYYIKNGLMGLNRIPTTQRLEVSGNASKSTAGDWLANSDQRLKKNINPLDPDLMLQKVLLMKGVSYEWNDSETGYDRPGGKQYGFIAQDLQKVWPEKVFQDEMGYLMTAYGDYDPMVVEAIRSLYYRVKALEEKVQALEGKQDN